MPAHVHPVVHEIYRAIHKVSAITLSLVMRICYVNSDVPNQLTSEGLYAMPSGTEFKGPSELILWLRRLSPPLGSGFGVRPLPAEWALKHHSSSMGDNLRTRHIFERKYESSFYETHCGST
ncbi:hypothetical protein G5I_02810 [Acromyrmex echinatior]|uniref:Uncharacterized protein n=1 Tax=Acromyrmex echinatior TaxID=103372 RepID=F4WBA3_ACREC|nr:hypothetical protein G5I_02810 [Acromyrmex echinatior]